MSVNDASKIAIDNSRVMTQIVASLTNNSRGVIYNRNMFIVQATGYLAFFNLGTIEFQSCGQFYKTFCDRNLLVLPIS